MTSDFTILRDAATKAATLRVTGRGAWEIYAGPAQDRIDETRPVASGTGPGEFTLPVSSRAWACFSVRRGNAAFLAAERHLPMRGGYNFRDLGGLAGAGGKRVAWGKFIRADELENLTGDDLAYLESMPLRTIVDFRTESEVQRAPDKVPVSVGTVLHSPVAPGYLNAGHTGRFTSSEDFMLGIYRDLALDPAIAETYRLFFKHVQNDKDVPILFHCAAGKDRTGVAAAFVLFALGVDREAVFADYTASNVYLGAKYAPIIASAPEQQGLYTVQPSFLAEALDLIEDRHGSVENYLRDVLEVDIPALRERYLY